VIAVEGSFYARQYLIMRPASEVLPRPEYAAFLQRDHGLFRVAALGRDTINAGWAAELQLELITGYDPYNFSHYGTYFDLTTRGRLAPAAARAWFDCDELARPDLLEALNVGYLVAPVPLEFTDRRFVPVATFRDQPVFTFYAGLRRAPLYVYRVRHALARAFFVDDVIGVGNDQAALSVMQAHSLDGIAVAELSTRGLQRSSPTASDNVQVRRARPDRLTVVTHTQARRFLVISEIWHPGWQATLDGHPIDLSRTDYALLGTFVSPGTHRVELRFEPLHWRLARNISLASLLIVLMLLAISFSARRRLQES
jgi:hypothetical protein